MSFTMGTSGDSTVLSSRSGRSNSFSAGNAEGGYVEAVLAAGPIPWRLRRSLRRYCFRQVSISL
jgi:hypothetical protein